MRACVFSNVLMTRLCREADMTKERIEKLLKAGANVILTTKGIDDMALKVRLFADIFLYLILPSQGRNAYCSTRLL